MPSANDVASHYTAATVTTDGSGTVTVTVVICGDGYYRSADLTCSPCTDTTLEVSSGTPILL
jgi:hypothetical protein